MHGNKVLKELHERIAGAVHQERSRYFVQIPAVVPVSQIRITLSRASPLIFRSLKALALAKLRFSSKSAFARIVSTRAGLHFVGSESWLDQQLQGLMDCGCLGVLKWACWAAVCTVGVPLLAASKAVCD